MSEETVYKAQAGKQVAAGARSLPVIFIAAGVLLLALNLFRVDLMAILWPGFVVGTGLLLLEPVRRNGPGSSDLYILLAIPGAFMATLGLILFALNLTDHWEAMSYLWLLFPASAVAGLMYARRHEPERGVHQWGHRLVRGLVIAMLIFAFFMEVFAFGALGMWWPLLLVGLGIYLLYDKRGS